MADMLSYGWIREILFQNTGGSKVMSEWKDNPSLNSNSMKLNITL